MPSAETTVTLVKGVESLEMKYVKAMYRDRR